MIRRPPSMRVTYCTWTRARWSSGPMPCLHEIPAPRLGGLVPAQDADAFHVVVDSGRLPAVRPVGFGAHGVCERWRQPSRCRSSRDHVESQFHVVVAEELVAADPG